MRRCVFAVVALLTGSLGGCALHSDPEPARYYLTTQTLDDGRIAFAFSIDETDLRRQHGNNSFPSLPSTAPTLPPDRSSVIDPNDARVPVAERNREERARLALIQKEDLALTLMERELAQQKLCPIDYSISDIQYQGAELLITAECNKVLASNN